MAFIFAKNGPLAAWQALSKILWAPIGFLIIFRHNED